MLKFIKSPRGRNRMKFIKYLIVFLCFTNSVSAGECDFIQFNKCYSCDDRYAFSVGSDEACSALCPNRISNNEGSGSHVIAHNCALTICPADFPFQSSFGSCFATQEEADIDDGENQQENTNNDNILDNYTDDIACPSDKPLQRWDGACFSCDESKAVRLPSHCNINGDCEDFCPNRTILYWAGGNIPSIPNCPPDKPLMDSEGICYPCDTPVAVGLDYNERLCQRFCPNEREISGIYCVLKRK